MTDYRLGAVESKFADLIWANEPIPSGELVRLARQQLDWKKSTTYTVLRRLCARGLFQNREGTVTSLLSREDFYAAQSVSFLEETFDGSLPKFLAAFTTRRTLSCEEEAAIRQLLDTRKE